MYRFCIPPLLLFISGCSTVHDFISHKTNLQLTDDFLVCSSGVDDTETCEPIKTGGNKWSENENFDVFALTNKVTLSNTQTAEDEIRWRYMGTPYYKGAIKPNCKKGIQTKLLAPNDNFLVDQIDLASELKSIVSSKTSSSLIFDLRAKGIDLDINAQASLKTELDKTIDEKANVQYLWFLIKWSGGTDEIYNDDNLNACMTVVNNQNTLNPNSASLITGVAGLIVINNSLDTTLSSESTIISAINATIPIEYSEKVAEMEATITSDWKNQIKTVFTTKGSLKANTQVVYPLWVRFAR